jgi:hypothetical protein
MQMMQERQLRENRRVQLLTQRVGFALWQLQVLESASAQYYVLVVHAKSGMGLSAGQALIDKAQSKTFGSTITQLAKSKKLSQALEARFRIVLTERNWLVHSSRPNSRKPIDNDDACSALIDRINMLAFEALSLLKEVGTLTEAYVKQSGVGSERIDNLTAQLLKEWYGNEAI